MPVTARRSARRFPACPTLAGQQAEFLVLQLFLLREGLRDVPQMAGMLKGWTDRDLQDVAAHYGAGSRSRGERQARSGSCTRAARGSRRPWAAAAATCGNYGGQQHVPRIANQREDYLAASLKAYRDNKRSGIDTSMNAAMYRRDGRDIQALAHFLANP